MVIEYISKPFTRVFGSRNDRLVKAYRRRVDQINALEPQTRQLTDEQLRSKTTEFQERVRNGERVSQLLPEVMSVAREAMDRFVGIREIFNPETRFDASRLPTDVQRIYEQIRSEGEHLEPQIVPGGDESNPVPWWLQVEVPNALYDAVRELYPQSRPPFRARPFDVQLIGGMVLGEGKIAEMKTGEGKTIVAPLACYVACIEGMQCHVVTVNDYLVQRDRDWVFPFYYGLGLTVGAIHPQHQQPPQLKQAAYDCNVVYGTNSEFGFDYLRDNMKLSSAEQFQKRRDFCIVDEIDSILIDEARTPLIISGPAHDDAPRYDMADNVAQHLIQKQREWDTANEKVERVEMKIKGLEGDIRNTRDKSQIPALKQEMKRLLEQELPTLEAERDRFTQYYEVERDKKAAHLTHDGVAEAQKLAGVGSFYVGNNMDIPHLLENALRAHAVYRRDKDYVVRDGEVIIVDEFTGRLMIGRQWSNGLHQAVEAKEKVKIKQETQTLATVTIQNFFKLYKRLAGMTGTAITEATEFDEIYDLDVVAIPTNRSIARVDRDDLIFLSEKDKWNAIVDEIKRKHDLGRPVLVGTTSVERSEMLSQLLTKKHGIEHEVLNAKIDQAEREGNLVAHAGELGAVMIATNMAGRGTDIKLGSIDRAALVRHWQVRNLLPKEATPQMSDDELVRLSYRHQAITTLGLPRKEAETRSDEELKLELLRHWCEIDAFVSPDKARKMSEADCMATLDSIADYQRHRLAVYSHVEEMGGLHIIGTERHESRRIDNQLRGRAGRQGDKGSSRFFISLEDDLMKLFMPKAMMTTLSKMGMKEGDAIEHRWVTRSVERAQRKVEERNYEGRKHVLEYDEVMEYQRGEFYGTRQEVLEGRNIDQLIFDYIGDAVEDAVVLYLSPGYVPNQVAEWCRANLDISVDPSKVRLDDLQELQEIIRREARYEVQQALDVEVGEYMSNDIPVEEWDLKGLSERAKSRYGVDLKLNDLREMNVDEVRDLLTDAAVAQVDRKDLSGLDKFLVPHYGARDLSNWARNKFGIELSPEQVEELGPEGVGRQILDQAREAYKRREITYPVEFIMDVVFQGAQQDQNWAIDQLVTWANQRYEAGWTRESVNGRNGKEIHETLLDMAESWLKEGGKLQEQVEAKVTELDGDRQKLAQWIKDRFGRDVDPADLGGEDGERDELVAKVRRIGREALRTELTQLERFVLLQILDQAWKDHLYAMDQLKDSIGLRGYAEKDPRIEYKREGASHFAEMQKTVRDRVTDLIFKARLTPNVQVRSAYGTEQQAQHATPQNAVAAAAAQARQAAPAAAAATAAEGTQQQREDLEAAAEAGNQGKGRPLTRKQRRATKARERKGAGQKAKFKKR